MSINDYAEYYDMDFSAVNHHGEILPLADFNIATHVFEPVNSLGTVIVVHGYYDHVAVGKRLISFLLDNHYTVIAFDLPGHGLSSGAKADIRDFHQYTMVLNELSDLALQNFSSPHYLIGHSTGGAIIIDGLLEERIDGFSSIILVSPLIRSSHWHLSKAGNRVADLFFDSVPRIFRKNSSDREYLEFIKEEDILQYRKVPLNWFRSLEKWNQKIDESEVSHREFLIIQGDKDITVDWKYNLNFIKNKFPKSQVMMIEGGNHQLYNEEKMIREQVFNKILDYLMK